MATTIDGVTVVVGGLRDRHSALHLADVAAKACLSKAGIVANDIDMLINAGLYRDGNMGEPALAPLIQEDIGANVEDPRAGRHGTFSFDVANGTCGVLTALGVAAGFLRSGTIATALLVASDADPGRHLAPAFPYAPTGGAALCRWVDGDSGLGAVRWINVPDDSFHSTVALAGRRNRLTVWQSAEFAERAGNAAAKVAHEALADSSLMPSSVGLVVANSATPAFLDALAVGLGVPAERIVAPRIVGAHTAGLLAALDAAIDCGRWSGAAPALLVAAGAGITAGAAVYRHGGP